MLARADLNQRLQGGGLGERHITRENHHHAIIRQHRHRLLHGVAGTKLRLLAHKSKIQGATLAGEGRLHRIGAMAGDHNRLAGMQLLRRSNHMQDQRLVRQALQHFGQAAFHARALTCGHDDHVHWRGKCGG